MSAYLVVHVDISDIDQYREYTKLTPPIVEEYGGKFIARGGDVVTLEGPEETRRIVIIEFPSINAAKAFYYSEEYTKAIELRKDAADFELVAIEGLN